MKKNILLLVLATVLPVLAPLENVLAQDNNLPTPEKYFGFQPGSDGNLFTYDELISYLKLLENASSRIKLEEIGRSPLGKPMYIAFFSGEENIGKLQEYKKINKELALNPELSGDLRKTYIRDGKVFLLATLSMHSTEVGPSQAASLVAYDLVTTKDERKLSWMNNVVLMMVPSHNPDGMDLVVDNYRKYKGTKYDGASLPDVYHKYVGHDNNRDFVTLSQEDTRVIAAIYNQTWFPQVMVEKHQMGSTGVRLFVPPNHDPIAENVPGSIFSWAGIFGQNMVNDLTSKGLKGVAQHYLFDDYWPGSTETCIWKNVIGFLTETASVRTASPVYIEPIELSVGGKGLSEYEKSVNMLIPWEGGWWRLGDIVEYEVETMLSILKTASMYREEILAFRNDLCREMVETGRTVAPFYYIMSRDQHDPGELVNMVALLKLHGVDIFRLDQDMLIGQVAYRKGDVVIPLAQPYRAFIKEVMEKQEYPERHYTPGGKMIEPYDITSWSLPLHRNVKAAEINQRDTELEKHLLPLEDKFTLAVPIEPGAEAVIFPVSSNESFRSAFAALEKGLEVFRLTEEVETGGKKAGTGSFLISLKGKNGETARSIAAGADFPVLSVQNVETIKKVPLKMPRIALVETYFHDMDAGWTRYLFDLYHVPYTRIRPHEIKDLPVEKSFDVIVFPDNGKDILMEGKRKSGENYYTGNYHPDYTKGIGKEGMQKITDFLEKGGHILCWGESAGLFEGTMNAKNGEEKEMFNLPFTDVSGNLEKSGLDIPGSFVKIDLLAGHPLTAGMPESTGVFSRGRPVFRTSLPGFDMDRRVIAAFPKKDILLSGYAANEEQIGNLGAMIWVRKGKGELVLFGFNPQFRASTPATYKLLFNALLL